MNIKYGFLFFVFFKIHLGINGKMPKGYKELIHENTTTIPTSTNMSNSKSPTLLSCSLILIFVHLLVIVSCLSTLICFHLPLITLQLSCLWVSLKRLGNHVWHLSKLYLLWLGSKKGFRNLVENVGHKTINICKELKSMIILFKYYFYMFNGENQVVIVPSFLFLCLIPLSLRSSLSSSISV